MKIFYFVVLLLACLTLTFGTWFETNGSLYQYFNVYSIELHNKSTYTPFITMSFGLWNHCAWNSTFVICSPVKMNNNLDINKALHIINMFDSSGSVQNTSETSTLVRFIPLLLASFFSVLSASISLYLLPENAKKQVQKRALLWINCGLCFINICLISVSYGITLQVYSAKITTICSLLNKYECQSKSPKIETALLGVSIGLFVLAAIYSINSFLRLKKSDITKHPESSRISYYTNQPETNEKQCALEVTESHHIMPPSELDEESGWSNERQKERLSLRPPPPLNKPNLANLGTAQHRLVQPFPESSSSLSVQDLQPPNLPFAKGIRPLSHGSDNTFGAMNRSSGMLADDSASHSSSFIDHRRGSNNTLMYSSGSNAPSNHTLGTFNLRQVSNQCDSVDYSSDDAGHTEIPDSTFNQNLHKRINDYLKKKNNN